VFLQRIYVLFFISLATRRIEYVACTPNPDGGWVAQQARNLIVRFGDQQPFRFLVHDRDAKLSSAFDEVFRTEGIRVIRTPVQAPNANAHAERWVRTLRAGCLDRILIVGRRHLDHVVRVVTSSADSSTNTTAPEFANPTGYARTIYFTRRCSRWAPSLVSITVVRSRRRRQRSRTTQGRVSVRTVGTASAGSFRSFPAKSATRSAPER